MAEKQLESTVAAAAFQKQWFGELRRRVFDERTPYALLQADVPFEIFDLLDIPAVSNQWWAALVAAKRQAPAFLDAMAGDGLPAQLCRYCSLGLATTRYADAGEAPWGGLPKPSLLCARLTCDCIHRVFSLWAEAFDTELRARLGLQVDSFNEFLDLDRLPQPNYREQLVGFLREKYRATRFDAIVAVRGPALVFVLQHRDQIFPGVPVVHAAVNARELARRQLPPDVIGAPIEYDPARTLDLALMSSAEAWSDAEGAGSPEPLTSDQSDRPARGRCHHRTASAANKSASRTSVRHGCNGRLFGDGAVPGPRSVAGD